MPQDYTVDGHEAIRLHLHEQRITVSWLQSIYTIPTLKRTLHYLPGLYVYTNTSGVPLRSSLASAFICIRLGGIMAACGFHSRISHWHFNWRWR